jgi:hypothetical protein
VSSSSELVKKSKSKRVDFVSESNKDLRPLSGNALAKRLGVSEISVRKHRNGTYQPGVSEWTRTRDPQGVAWEYREDTRMYHPTI